MSFKKSLPLIAVGVFVMYMAINFLPWLSAAQQIDTCLDQGGAWNPDSEMCEK